MTELVVDWCSYKAAKYAVEHWHYSGTMPAGKTVKVGAWEYDRFIGAVIYSMGANRNIGKPYGLDQTEVCELVRVALTEHEANVSKIVAATIKKLKDKDPGLRLIVSYSDTAQEHLGIIYQAMNFVYEGEITGGMDQLLMPDGNLYHKRSVFSKYGTCNADELGARWIKPPKKFKYLYPLDRAMRRQIEPLAQPYPKSCGQSVQGNTPDYQSGNAGSSPAVRSNMTGGEPVLV